MFLAPGFIIILQEDLEYVNYTISICWNYQGNLFMSWVERFQEGGSQCFHGFQFAQFLQPSGVCDFCAHVSQFFVTRDTYTSSKQSWEWVDWKGAFLNSSRKFMFEEKRSQIQAVLSLRFGIILPVASFLVSSVSLLNTPLLVIMDQSKLSQT